jgi:hypothetical protein
MIRSRNIKLAAAVIGVSAAAALPPVAFSFPEDTGTASSYQPLYVNPSTGYPSSLPTPASNASVSAATPAEPEALADQPSSTAGFDWPSAAIGAGAGAALLLMLLGATIGVGRRGRRPLRSGAH